MTEESKFEIRKPPAELAQSQEPIVLKALEDYPYKSVALGSTRANLTGLWRYWRPYYQNKRAPCDAACPVGNHVVDYIQSMLEGHWAEAANILRSENPLPGITGRVCHRPCEMACNRRQYDKRIDIHAIESVLADGPSEALQFPPPGEPHKIAVIGSGSAELAFAHFAALLHHQVTLFDTATALGGRLRYGPPSRHLPDGLLDAEIERIVSGRIEVQRCAVTLDGLKSEYDVAFGVLHDPEHLVLWISSQDRGGGANLLDRLAGGEAKEDGGIKIPLRVSEAIGYGKWAALMLDADWRALDASATLTQIQVGGNPRIVSAMKYLALLTGHEIRRSEEVLSYDKLHLDMLDSLSDVTPAQVAEGQKFASAGFVSADEIQHVLWEAARCFSCGRCNGCDNCWIYCPDGLVTRQGGTYAIDYDYCKGCTLCAAVCPRGAISIIEEEKWSG